MRNPLEFFAKKKVKEVVDNKPVALPVGFKPDPEKDRLHHLMRTLVRDLEEKGVIPNQAESFEQSLDFELPDDEDGDVVFAANSGRLSQGEIKYMQEERMLTEAEEAAKTEVQRRAVDHYRRKYGKGRSDEGRESASRDGPGPAGEKRSAGGEQSAELGSNAGAAKESGK